MRLDWETHGVVDDFRQCQMASQNTDLVFHCTNGNVSAHQMIFAGISPLFTDLMQRYLIGQELIPLDLNISLPEICREHMEMVVEIVYTGQVLVTQKDYPPFREICQLLDLCVPIAYYDKVFMNQCNDGDDDFDGSIDDTKFALHSEIQIPEVSTADDDHFFMNQFNNVSDDDYYDGDDGDVATSEDDTKFVQHSEAQIPEVSTPMKSLPDPRVFQCDQCSAIFSLKIALKKHEQRRHSENELGAHLSPDTDMAEPPEVSSPPNTERVKTRQRSSSMNNENSFDSSDDESTFECPDCLKRFTSNRVRDHLATHLEKQLNELISGSQSVSGGKKCKWCSFITSNLHSMRRHMSATHIMVMEFVSEAQKKFLQDADQIFPERRGSCSEQSKQSRHGEIESDPDDEDDTTSSAKDSLKPQEVSNPPNVQRVNEQQTSLKSSKNSSKWKNTTVVCPDCRKHIRLKWIRQHFATHLHKQLDELFTESESTPGRKMCKLCSVEIATRKDVRIHLGVAHNLLSKFANDAQKKFLEDVERMIPKHGWRRDKVAQPRLRTTQSYYASSDEPSIKCSDCLENIKPFWARHHLIYHMRKELNEFVISGKGPAKKCKICPYESTVLGTVRRHLTLTHNMVVKLANKAQKQFLADADIINKITMADRKKDSPSLPIKRKTRNQNPRNQEIKEPESSPEDLHPRGRMKRRRRLTERGRFNNALEDTMDINPS